MTNKFTEVNSFHINYCSKGDFSKNPKMGVLVVSKLLYLAWTARLVSIIKLLMTQNFYIFDINLYLTDVNKISVINNNVILNSES